MKLPNYIEMMERAARELDDEALSLEREVQPSRPGQRLNIIV